MGECGEVFGQAVLDLGADGGADFEEARGGGLNGGGDGEVGVGDEVEAGLRGGDEGRRAADVNPAELEVREAAGFGEAAEGEGERRDLVRGEGLREFFVAGGGVIEEDLVGDEGEVAGGAEVEKAVGVFATAHEPAGGIVRMDDGDGAGGRSDGGGQGNVVELPEGIRGGGVGRRWLRRGWIAGLRTASRRSGIPPRGEFERIRADAPAVEGGEVFDERVGRMGCEDFRAGVAEEFEEEAVGFAGAGGEVEAVGVDGGGAAVMVLGGDGFAGGAEAAGVGFVGGGSAAGEGVGDIGGGVMEAGLDGVGEGEVVDGQAGDAASGNGAGERVVVEDGGQAGGEVHAGEGRDFVGGNEGRKRGGGEIDRVRAAGFRVALGDAAAYSAGKFPNNYPA